MAGIMESSLPIVVSTCAIVGPIEDDERTEQGWATSGSGIPDFFKTFVEKKT